MSMLFVGIVPAEARVAYRDSKFNQIGFTLAPFLMEFVRRLLLIASVFSPGLIMLM